ncbi:hypothetical protein PUR_11950 [Paenibacillus sp. URB8-2]|nr:hypothetical protein PUR_11950 [Paenibacillus sp. URB8-2]
MQNNLPLQISNGESVKVTNEILLSSGRGIFLVYLCTVTRIQEIILFLRTMNDDQYA